MAISGATTPAQLQELLNGPALEPTLGVTPDFENPPNYRPVGLACRIITLLLATIAICMRMYTKSFIVRKLNSADCKLVGSLVLGWTDHDQMQQSLDG